MQVWWGVYGISSFSDHWHIWVINEGFTVFTTEELHCRHHSAKQSVINELFNTTNNREIEKQEKGSEKDSNLSCWSCQWKLSSEDCVSMQSSRQDLSACMLWKRKCALNKHHGRVSRLLPGLMTDCSTITNTCLYYLYQLLHYSLWSVTS